MYILEKTQGKRGFKLKAQDENTARGHAVIAPFLEESVPTLANGVIPKKDKVVSISLRSGRGRLG